MGFYDMQFSWNLNALYKNKELFYKDYYNAVAGKDYKFNLKKLEKMAIYVYLSIIKNNKSFSEDIFENINNVYIKEYNKKFNKDIYVDTNYTKKDENVINYINTLKELKFILDSYNSEDINYDAENKLENKYKDLKKIIFDLSIYESSYNINYQEILNFLSDILENDNVINLFYEDYIRSGFIFFKHIDCETVDKFSISDHLTKKIILQLFGKQFDQKIINYFEKGYIDLCRTDNKSKQAQTIFTNITHPFVSIYYCDNFESLLELVHELAHVLAWELNIEDELLDEVIPTYVEYIAYKKTACLTNNHDYIKILNKRIMTDLIRLSISIVIKKNLLGKNIDEIEKIWLKIIKKLCDNNDHLINRFFYEWIRIDFLTPIDRDYEYFIAAYLSMIFLKKYNDVLKATGITATAGKGYAKKRITAI